MEINASVNFQVLGSKATKSNSQVVSKNGFFHSLLNIVQTEKAVKSSLKAELKTEDSSGNDLKELIEFMNFGDLHDIEGGNALIDQVIMNSDTDLLQLVREYFGVSEQKWSELLESLSGFKDTESLSLELNEQTKPEVDVKQMEMFLAGLFSLHPKEFQTSVTKDAQTFMKAAKLYELLAANQDNNHSFQLKGLIKQLAERLETLSKDNRNSMKFDILQKTFTPLATELNKNITVGASTGSDFSEPVRKAASKSEVLQGTPLLGQQFSKPEQITMMVNGNRKPVSGDQLMQQFESVLSKSSFVKTGGAQRLLIRLNPEHLGSLRIELIQKEDGMIARFLTTSGSAKEILETHLNGLKQAFTAQNIPIDKIEISQQMGQQERFLNREQPQQQEEQQKNDSQKEKDQNQHNDEFTHTFEEALLNTEI